MANSEFGWPANRRFWHARQSPRRAGQGDRPREITFDINRPGMLYGRMVRSPHPHARVVRSICPPLPECPA